MSEKSKIEIKPENKGKFTEYAKAHGESVQGMANKVLASKQSYSPTIIKRANFAKNAAGWNHSNGGFIYANGGNMNQITEFNEGGPHELNKLGGVPQGIGPDGQPNLVEEGETKLNSANYIFSDRLSISPIIAKDYGLSSKFVGKTFSDASKKISDPKSRRIDDTIEEKAKERSLNDLMYAQEAFKQQDLEQSIAAIAERHPEMLQQMQQPQTNSEQLPEQSIDEQPMMAKGGKMYYDFGGFVNKAGSIMSTAAPWLSKIPGVGIVAGVAAGALGAGLENVGTGADAKEVLKDTTLGGLEGASGLIPGGQMAAGLLTNMIDNKTTDASEKAALDEITGGNQFPDGGTMNNPNYNKQLQVYNEYKDPSKFSAVGTYDPKNFIEGEALNSWLKETQMPLDAYHGLTPSKVYFDGTNRDKFYPVFNTPSKTTTVPPTTTSDVQIPYVKPVIEETQVPVTANRSQTYYQQDPKTGEWGKPQVRSAAYAQKNEKGTYDNLDTPTIVWVDSQGVEHTTDPRQATAQPQTFAEGGTLPNLEGIDPAVLAYIQQLQQSQNLNQAGQIPDYAASQNIQVPEQVVNEQIVEDTPQIATVENIDPNNIEELGAQMLEANDPETEAAYKSRLESANESLTNANQDLRVQQTPLEGIAEALPVAYNIGQGLFGKVGELNIDDYLANNKIEAPKINIDPQVKETEQSYATAANGVRNAGPSSGAYMTNLQQLSNSRNEQLGEIMTNKENIDAQNKMQADQFNASMNANNNNIRFQLEDYNARAKGAKQAMLSQGLTQAADIGRSATANKLATSFYSIAAPDFKNQVGYKSFFDYLKEKKQGTNTEK